MENRNFNSFQERLATFEKWPTSAVAFEKSLVEAGFVYTGEKDKVFCFKCHLVHENWKEDEDPLEYHQQMNKNCPYLLQRLDRLQNSTEHQLERSHFSPLDILSVKTQEMQSYGKRFESFAFSPVNKHWPPVAELAKNGFYWVQSKNLMCCFCCGLSFDSWESPNQDILQRHRANSPLCAFAFGKTTSMVTKSTSNAFSDVHLINDISIKVSKKPTFNHNENDELSAQSQFQSSMHLNHNGQVDSMSSSSLIMSSFDSSNTASNIGPVRMLAYHPSEFSDRVKRLQTFATWPRHVPINPVELCDSGFYYLKKDDCVKCHICYVTLHNWLEGDSAWVEHEKFSPECPSVKEHIERTKQAFHYPTPEIHGQLTVFENTKDPLLRKFLCDTQQLQINSLTSESMSNLSYGPSDTSLPENFENYSESGDIIPQLCHGMRNIDISAKQYPCSGIAGNSRDITNFRELTQVGNLNYQSKNRYHKDDHPTYTESVNIYGRPITMSPNREIFSQNMPSFSERSNNYYTNLPFRENRGQVNTSNITRDNDSQGGMKEDIPFDHFILQKEKSVSNSCNNPYILNSMQSETNISSGVLPKLDENKIEKHTYENALCQKDDCSSKPVFQNQVSKSSCKVQRVSENDIEDLLELGYSKQLIEKTIECYKQYSPHNFLTKDQLMLAVEHFKDHGNLEGTPFGKNLTVEESVVKNCLMFSQKAEFEPSTEIEVEKNCCICHDNVIEVTLVPCGHLCICVSCAFGIKECPLCRSNVENTQRTFFYGN